MNIFDAIDNNTQVLPIEEAKKVGAISLFDEKYGKEVRVVSFGDVSKEFCGGNHVKNTSDIGVFVIETEGSIANGVRRIQAKTSFKAYELLKQREELLNEIKEEVEAKSYKESIDRVKSIENQLDEMTSKYKILFDDLAKEKVHDLESKFEKSHVIFEYLKDYNSEALMKIYDSLKVKYDDFTIVLIGDDNGKHPIICGIGKKLVDNCVKSKDILKSITDILGGAGGGRPDMSKGSVLSLEKLDSAKKVILK